MQTLLSNVHNSTHVLFDYANSGLQAVITITYVYRIAVNGTSDEGMILITRPVTKISTL